jgi:flagellar motor switch protein FliN/FliY
MSAARGDGAARPEQDLALVLDLPVEVTVELGRKRLSIGEVLALGQGAVVELGKQATEPLDIRVNEKLIAHGEAVVVGDRYAIRVTDVVSPKERMGSVGAQGAT